MINANCTCETGLSGQCEHCAALCLKIEDNPYRVSPIKSVPIVGMSEAICVDIARCVNGRGYLRARA